MMGAMCARVRATNDVIDVVIPCSGQLLPLLLQRILRKCKSFIEPASQPHLKVLTSFEQFVAQSYSCCMDIVMGSQSVEYCVPVIPQII
jgi:hypothetical protein